MSASDDRALRWRCRRGMRELDVLLSRYLDNQYVNANPDEQASFKHLLTLQDPEIFGYLVGRDTPSDARIAHIVQRIRS